MNNDGTDGKRQEKSKSKTKWYPGKYLDLSTRRLDEEVKQEEPSSNYVSPGEKRFLSKGGNTKIRRRRRRTVKPKKSTRKNKSSVKGKKGYKTRKH